MSKGLLFFNSGIGDTILASGLCKKFSRHFDKEVFLAEKMTGVIGAWARQEFGVSTYTSKNVNALMDIGNGMRYPIKKHFNLNHMFYSYKEEEVSRMLLPTIHKLLDELVQIGFDELFIMHYSYPFALLGQEAQDRGFRVQGYFLNRLDGLMQSNRHHEPIPAVIWDKEYIGDRLSRMVTGSFLNREKDFKTYPNNFSRDKITLFPTSKSLTSNAGNWHMDVELLRYMGYRTEVMYHTSEIIPKEIEQSGLLCTVLGSTIESLDTMLNQIQTSEFIICYDSAAFHMAWLTNTPAIVKLKGGFNQEWIPSWVLKEDWEDNYVLIPSNEMYEEEYLTHITRAIRQLQK